MYSVALCVGKGTEKENIINIKRKTDTPLLIKSLSNLNFLLYEKKIDYWFVVHAGSGSVHNEFDGS